MVNVNEQSPSITQVGVQVAELMAIHHALEAVPSLVERSGWGDSDQNVDTLRRQMQRKHLPLETYPRFGGVVLDQLVEVMPVTRTTEHGSEEYIRRQNAQLADAIKDQTYRVINNRLPKGLKTLEANDWLADAALTNGVMRAGLMIAKRGIHGVRWWKPEVVAAAGFVRGDIDDSVDREFRASKEEILSVIDYCARKRPIVDADSAHYRNIDQAQTNKQGFVVANGHTLQSTKLDLFWKALRGDLMS
jgi:hypothetical protein